LVLADFVMPGADGAWLIQSLRSEGGSVADVPVVLTTGSSTGREIAASLGICALEKPFDMNRLLDIVRRTARASP
jgi:DNA-binding NtrC family response regulator